MAFLVVQPRHRETQRKIRKDAVQEKAKDLASDQSGLAVRCFH